MKTIESNILYIKKENSVRSKKKTNWQTIVLGKQVSFGKRVFLGK